MIFTALLQHALSGIVTKKYKYVYLTFILRTLIFTEETAYDVMSKVGFLHRVM